MVAQTTLQYRHAERVLRGAIRQAAAEGATVEEIAAIAELPTDVIGQIIGPRRRR